MHAIRTRSLSEQVFEQLAAEIITGRYAPGTYLPAERALTGVFDVNRHVVREALKRLEQVGLVKVAQGGGTRVLDFKRQAGLDLLALMSEHSRVGEDVAIIWRSVLEMRASIAADLVRLCALRGSAETKRELVELAQKMKEATTDAELFALDIRFWETMADGAANMAYRLALNTMVRSAQANGETGVQWGVVEIRANDYRVPLAAAIAAGDAVKAESDTRDAMRAAVDQFAVVTGTAVPTMTKPVMPPAAEAEAVGSENGGARKRRSKAKA
ncbi:MAG TPA: GntR family transcriptional regulator [Opitutaceae bacterium]|nr:GntR family transcriptional regulator [Opitutaceae bacterium]